MRRLMSFVRRWLPRISLSVIGVQIGAMAGLTAYEAMRKKRRRLRRFPYLSSEPIQVGDDEVNIYTYGEHLYADMLEAIAQAKESVLFGTFIWKSDATGRAFKQALIDAAERGVRVYVTWDGFGNLVVPPRFFRMPNSVHAYKLPTVAIPWSPRHWGRDHRKLLVVDNEVGFLGGYNIGDLYATGWRDTHARVKGPAVAEIENAFVDYWNMHAVPDMDDELESTMERAWQSQIRLHRNTPRIRVYPIRNMYLEAIDRATERIWLTHAYLIPDDFFVAALRDAARRGVDVRIIVPAKSNHVVADWLSRSYYTDLLNSGIRLFLYQGAMVHSKTATIDGTWSTIGTANLDRLSLLGNYEINLEITDEQVAEEMERIFRMDEGNTIELSIEDWRHRSWLTKSTETLLRPWRLIF